MPKPDLLERMEDMTGEQDFSKLPKPRVAVPVGRRRVVLGGAPGGMPLIAAILLGIVGFLVLQAYVFKAPFELLSQGGDLLFSTFIALSFGFLFIAFFGHGLYQIRNQWVQGAVLGVVIAIGIKYGIPILEWFHAPISASPLATLSVGGNVAGFILPFAFLIDGVDYTWAFLIVVVGTLYYTFDDWYGWIRRYV